MSEATQKREAQGRRQSPISARGHSRRDWLRATIGPRPLRPESDHSRHESEMARWANFGSRRLP